MQVCRCEEYKKHVQNLKFNTVGTMHHLHKRLEVPDDYYLKLIRNSVHHEDLRFDKPAQVLSGEQDVSENLKEEKAFESKWVPVMPGLISQRLVNESKNLKSPF
ncbi:uncharacterized protein [Leptinotarsa decemlineata]|uniref:uncharacterized protein n=1 Tax=Leptinotarsa decemlineata TaxID=7539 RepID=UPI003D3085A0